MCGLVGFIGTKTNKTSLKIFRTLLFLNVLRGTDGTGVIKLDKHKKKDPIISWEKTEDNAIDYMHEKNEVLTHSSTTKGWLGHCRAATVGGKNTKNSHPFEFPSLIGMHNGTISQKYPNQKDYTTDSEALYHEIDAYGIDQALKNFHTSYGAWALVYYDKTNDSVNLVRNSRRPLHCCYTTDQTGFIYSSDPVFLTMALRDNHIVHDEIWSLKEHTLLTLYMSDDSQFTNQNTKVTKLTEYVYPVYQHKGNNLHLKGNKFTPKSVEIQNDQKLLPLLAEIDMRKFDEYQYGGATIPNDDDDDYTMYIGPYNRIMEKDEYEILLKKGCANCLDPIELEDYVEYGQSPDITWLIDGNFVCSACKDLPVVQNSLPPHIRNTDKCIDKDLADVILLN